MNKQPERTAATKQSIIDAFWAIAMERGIHNVTISAVAKAAGLNRGTFYVYFEDMHDLLRQAEEVIAKSLRGQMQEVLADGIPADFQSASKEIVQILSQYDEKLFLLLGKDGDSGFISLFRNEMTDMFRTLFRVDEAVPEFYQEHIIAYLTSGFAGLFTYWYEHGKPLSMKELAEISYSFAAGGLLRSDANHRYTDISAWLDNLAQ